MYMVGSMGSNIFISGKVSCSYHVKMLSTGQVCYLGLWVSIVGGSIFYGDGNQLWGKTLCIRKAGH